MNIIEKLHIIISTIAFAAISLSTVPFPQNNANTQNSKHFIIGYMHSVFNDVDRNDAQAALKVWTNEFVKSNNYQSGYRLNVKIYNNFDEVFEDLKTKVIADLAMNTLDYFLYVDKLGLDPVLVPSINGNVGATYYILVRKNGNLKSLKDLRNKVFGISSDYNHVASRIWLDVTLAGNKLPTKEVFFKNIIEVKKESQLLLNLFFGQVDACIVSKHAFELMSELNPQVGNNLTPILISPTYLQGMMCFLKSFNNPNDRKVFYDSALELQKTPSGKQIFSLIKIDKIIPFKDSYLDSYRKLLRDYNYLIKTKKIKMNEYY